MKRMKKLIYVWLALLFAVCGGCTDQLFHEDAKSGTSSGMKVKFYAQRPDATPSRAGAKATFNPGDVIQCRPSLR